MVLFPLMEIIHIVLGALVFSHNPKTYWEVYWPAKLTLMNVCLGRAVVDAFTLKNLGGRK